MTLCQDLMMDTHCWGLTCYAARSGSGFANKMLWLLIDSLYVKIWQVSPKHWTWDMTRLSTWLVLGSCARAILHESHACRVLVFRCWTSLWSCLDERIMWDKQLAGSSSVLLQLWHARKNTKAMAFFLCAIWTFVGKVWRWWDCSLWWLDCCDSGRKFQGMTVAPEAFELSHGLPRWSARACELLKLQNLC